MRLKDLQEEGKEDQRQKGRGGREARTGGGRRGGDALRSREEPRGAARREEGSARRGQKATATGVGGPPQKSVPLSVRVGPPQGGAAPPPWGCFQKPSFSRFSFRFGEKVPSPPALSSGAPCSPFVAAASPPRTELPPPGTRARRPALPYGESSSPPPLPSPSLPSASSIPIILPF